MGLFSTREPDPDSIDIIAGGEIVSVRLARHPRARRCILRVDSARRAATLTLPKRTALSTAERFLAAHSGWLADRLAAMPDAVAFEPGAIIPIRDVPHRLEATGRARGRVSVGTNGTDQEAVLHVPGTPEHFARRLGDWLRDEARADLADRVAFHADRLELTPGRITIRDQSSRWGSCSASGALSFSWRLILAPPDVLDYLAAHEVAHLAELNHGPRFWALVRRTMPEMDGPRAWLKQHGSELHRYG